MPSSGRIEIRGCRKDRLYNKCQSKLTGIDNKPLEELREKINIPDVANFWILSIGIIHLIVAVVHLVIYAKKELNRNGPDTCIRRQTAQDCLTYEEYNLVFETVCASVDSDDPTYKAMKRNFDDAILHQMLKAKDNSTCTLKIR